MRRCPDNWPLLALTRMVASQPRHVELTPPRKSLLLGELSRVLLKGFS